MNDITFDFPIGNTYTRDFVVDGYTSDIDNVYFTVKKSNLDERFVLQKMLEDGIELVDVSYNPDGSVKSRTYNILIDASDTEGLTPDFEYSFDIKLITNTEEGKDPIKKTIVEGTFIVSNNTTRAYNESSGD